MLGLILVTVTVHAQPLSPEASPSGFLSTPGILRNSISNLHAEGDSLWVGPFLNLTTDGGTSWQVADADSLAGFNNRVYSIDVEGPVIWTGLGLSASRTIDGQSQNVDLARGFVVSEDGGQSWHYRSFLPPSDNDPTTTGILDLAEDTLLVYGVSTLPALPVIVPEQSPPWDIDYDAVRREVWSANWASGVRMSSDGGRTWRRVVLPPDDLDAIHPDSAYDFLVAPRRGNEGHYNHMGFSVLVDALGTVWAGTAGGLNRSTDGGISWRRYDRDDGLLGNWIISIEEQHVPGRPPAVWATNWPAVEQGERFGVVVTRDGGETFDATLQGERIYDFAFRGETVYAAGENGLFISEDGGITWLTVRDFVDPTQPDRVVRPGLSVFSVAVTRDALWAGTSDGLFKSTDGGRTWRQFRTNVPLDPADAPSVVPEEMVPRVEAYAYPNPFSPIVDRLVRIRFDLDRPQQVRVRLFDFGMNLVRDLGSTSEPAGAREIAWDGTDDRGVRVANGTYFYAVEADEGTFWGKILVLE